MKTTRNARRSAKRPQTNSLRLPSLANVEAPFTREEEILLAVRAQHGDRQAMGRLLSAWQPPILAEIAQLGRVREREDMFQLAMLAAMEAVNEFDALRGECSVLSLALARVRSRLFDRVRVIVLERKTLAEEASRVRRDRRMAPSPEEECIAAEGRGIARCVILGALETLNPEQRRVIDARYVRARGCTRDCLGASMGVSREKVRRIEVAALAELARLLGSNATPAEIVRALVGGAASRLTVCVSEPSTGYIPEVA